MRTAAALVAASVLAAAPAEMKALPFCEADIPLLDVLPGLV